MYSKREIWDALRDISLEYKSPLAVALAILGGGVAAEAAYNTTGFFEGADDTWFELGIGFFAAGISYVVFDLCRSIAIGRRWDADAKARRETGKNS